MDGDESEDVQIVDSDNESLSEATEKESPVDSAELKLRAIITEGSLDFDGWTALIAAIEKTYPDDIEKICLVYESFLSKFPLCYGYWRKYADHKTHLCTVDKVVEVFERAVQSATYSVHVWVDYCSFSMSAFEDPCDVRRLFKRGLSFVGKDYLCHTLWDKFIEFELSQQQWSSLAHIYIQTLRFPTKKLHHYYDSFKKLVAVWEEEMECQSNASNELQPMHDNEVPTSYKDDEIKSIIKELLDPSIGSARSHALSKYLSIGEHYYKTASQLDEKLCCFETRIRRSYFHVKPLDVSQLETWHHYLDFVEAQGDFDWAVKLNERCLIPCSNYPEFWMRYVEFMETNGGRELANFALDRATQIFLKRVPVIHLFNARFKEQVGDVLGSRAAVLQCDAESDSSFVENVIRKANMEKRLGNYVAASNIYIEALEMAAAKEKLQDLPLLYVHFSRLKFLTTDSADAARDILIDGIKHVCNCKLLLQELLNFALMHGGARHIVLIDSVIASTIFSELGASQGLSAEEREEISNLYLEFVDLCGTIRDIRNAWNRHIKWFPYSLRTPATVAPSHVTIEERKENFFAMLQQSSGKCSEDCLTRHLSPDKIQLHPENHDTRSNEPTADQISDQNSPLQKNQDIESDHAAIDQQEADETRHRVQQVSEVSEQPKEDVAEPIVSSPHLLHEVANESESIPASRGYPKSTLHDDNEYEQDVKPPSLERLSLNAEDNKSPSSIPTTSHDYEAPQETCTSNGSMESGRNTGNRRSYSQICNQTSDFANIQRQAATPSSSASHQNPTTHELWQPSMPANSSRNWHQMKYNNRMRRDSKFGFRGPSQKRPHQQRHNSSQQQYPRAEIGPQMPVSQGFAPLQNSQADPCNLASNQYQAHASLSQPHGALMQNVQQPSLSQPSAQPIAYPQSQMVQYPTQGNLQYGNMQNSEAYNQMWQYYYYQQQQQQQFFLQQQQQLLQQQQQLDPQQQQLLQQQYQQQLQLQQQYFYQQQQQFQQLSEQQQQQFQQMSQQQQQEPDQAHLQQQSSQPQQEPDQAHLQQQSSQPQQLQQEQQIDQQQQFNTQQQLQQQQQFQQQYLQQQQLLQQQQHLLYLQQLQQSQMQKQGEEQEQPSQQQQQQQQEQVHEHHHHHKYYDSSSNLEVESRPWITESQSRGVTPPQHDLTEATGSVVSAASPQRQERSPTISV